MKKYLLIATVTLGLALTACGGGTKTETAPTAPETEQVIPVDAATPEETTPAEAEAVPADSATVAQ